MNLRLFDKFTFHIDKNTWLKYNNCTVYLSKEDGWMNREEILEKARKEGNGEYEEQLYGQILRQGTLLLTVLCMVFWILQRCQLLRTETAPLGLFGFPAILMGYAAYVYLATYVRMKRRSHLLYGAAFAVGFVVMLIRSLMML